MTRAGLFRSLAGAAVLSLFIGGPASAYTIGVEIADAPDLPPGQSFVGPIQEITGELSIFDGDLVDMFGFYIGNPFSAVTVRVDEFYIADPVLYLFDAAGKGVYMDDDSGGLGQAALGALPSGYGVGWYFLAIAFSGVQPIDSFGNAIFDVFGDLGVTSVDAVAGWDGSALSSNFDLPGKYSIRVTGVPEPGTFLLLLAGLGALGFRPSRFGRG
jgi:hypothetical protein